MAYEENQKQSYEKLAPKVGVISENGMMRRGRRSGPQNALLHHTECLSRQTPAQKVQAGTLWPLLKS